MHFLISLLFYNISFFWGEVGGDWKRLNSEELGIRTSMIPKSTRKVLNGLKRNGSTVALGL